MSLITHLPSHNRGGKYISPPGSPQEDLPWVGGVEMIQNNHPGFCFYPHQNHPYYSHTSIPPHPIIFSYYTSSPIYATYEVAHHPQILYVGYLYCPPQSSLTSSTTPNLIPSDLIIFPQRRITGHRRNRSNRWSNIMYSNRREASIRRLYQEYQEAQETQR